MLVKKGNTNLGNRGSWQQVTVSFSAFAQDTAAVSDTLIAVKMKCVISKSKDALGSRQIALLSQIDTLVSFIVFVSLHRGSSLTSLLEERFRL